MAASRVHASFLLIAASVLASALAPAADALNYYQVPNPATLPTGSGRVMTWSSDDQFLVVGHTNPPSISIYQRSDTTFTKLNNPSTLPAGNTRGVAFSPDDSFLATAHESSPYVSIYTRSGSTFTKLGNPANLPAGVGTGAAWSPDGNYLAITHATSPYVTIYSRSGSTFTKISNPTALPTGVGRGVEWSPDGAYVAIAHDTSPYLTMYSQSGSTFTKLSNPAVLPTGNGAEVEWNDDGDLLTVGHANAPYFTSYAVAAGPTFTKIDNPATLPVADISGIDWRDDTLLMGGTGTLEYQRAEGPTLQEGGVPPVVNGVVDSVAFSHNGDFLGIGYANSPYLSLYFVSDAGTELINPTASMATTQLTGFDVDPTGSTAIARTNGGQYVRVYPGGTLGTPSSTTTDCDALAGGVATLASHVAYVTCDSTNDPVTLRIRNPSLGSPNLAQECNDGSDWCQSNINLKDGCLFCEVNVEGDQDDDTQLSFFEQFPIDYSQIRTSGYNRALMAFAFADTTGQLGVWTYTHVHAGQDSSALTAVGISNQSPDQICTHRDANGANYLYGSSTESNVRGFRVTFTERGQFDGYELVPEMSLVFPGTGSTAGPRGVACGEGKVAVANLNRITVFARAENGQSGNPLWSITTPGQVPVRGIELSSDGQVLAYAQGSRWSIVNANNGTVYGGGFLPSGSFQDMELQGHGCSLWIAVDSGAHRYDTSQAVCPSGDAPFNPVVDPADLDGDGIPNSADPDVDGDGIHNDVDLDDDGDGIPDEVDVTPGGSNDPNESGDFFSAGTRFVLGLAIMAMALLFAAKKISDKPAVLFGIGILVWIANVYFDLWQAWTLIAGGAVGVAIFSKKIVGAMGG